MRFALSFAACAALTVVVVTGAPPLCAAEIKLPIEVAAGAHDREQTPVKMVVAVPTELQDATSAQLTSIDGKQIIGQLSGLSLTAPAIKVKEGHVPRELTFILDKLPKGETANYVVTINSDAAPTGDVFAWRDTPGNYNELQFGTRPVLRYMYQQLDDARREETYKPYHAVYNPSGEQIITKGPGGQFTHHRGIYFGFSRCKYGEGKSADTWHCNNGAFQSHEEFLNSEAGPVFGRHRVAIDWHGNDKKTFAREEREITVYHVPGGNLIEFASRLTSLDGDLKLDGDPQHAGFHFRAAQEVAAKTKGQTYYVRPDGAGKPGETRNWPGDKQHVNLPWNAMSFVVGDQRYTTAYLDQPTNPKEARFSERDYGRFGSYFVADVPQNQPLTVNYRIWLQAGELDGARVGELSANFVEPPRGTVKW